MNELEFQKLVLKRLEKIEIKINQLENTIHLNDKNIINYKEKSQEELIKFFKDLKNRLESFLIANYKIISSRDKIFLNFLFNKENYQDGQFKSFSKRKLRKNLKIDTNYVKIMIEKFLNIGIIEEDTIKLNTQYRANLFYLKNYN